MPGSRFQPDVFVLSHEFFPRRGGIGTFVEEVAQATAGSGKTVEVWAPSAPIDDTPPPAWPFAVQRLPMRGSHGPSCVATTWKTLLAQRDRWRDADLCLAEPGPMLAMMLLPDCDALCPRRLSLVFHGSEILRFHENVFLRPLARRLIRRANRVGVLTDYTERLLLERFPEANGKIVRTPGAPRSSNVAAAPRERRSPADPVVVLTVGRIHPRKGQLATLRALSALPAQTRARLEYRLAGSASRPEHMETLRAAADSSGVRVTFLGSLPDEQLARAYDEADIFALTSVPHGHSVEGFGLVYLEASARALPIVAHAIGGVPEAVRDGVTGLLAPTGDTAALTAAFSRLIDDAGLRRQLGEAGREWAARHDWRRAAEALFGP